MIDVNPAHLLLASPVVAAAVLLVITDCRRAAQVNVGACAAVLGLAGLLSGWRPEADELVLVDDFNVYLIGLTAFVAFTTSVFSMGYVARELETGRIAPRTLRFYHSMFQAFLFTLYLALLANNLGVLWVAVEGATLTTVLMVSLYRTPAAIEAAWKYFILCGVGIALALFGTILLYLAAQPVLGQGGAAMTWTALLSVAGRIDPKLLDLAFVFLLVGYGTKVGLFPLQGWLADAHAEGPTPISAVLSGMLLNVALYAVLRFKMLAAAHGGAVDAGPLLTVMGAATLLFAAAMLYRRKDAKRLFAYSSIEHMGIATVAFGLGGPVGNFAGLLHMTLHSLTKSAIFFAVGQACQVVGSQKLSEIRGLTVSHPALGWGLVLGVVAIVGLPPFGLFVSEFLLITSAAPTTPLVAVTVALGLLLALGALVARMQELCFGDPAVPAGDVPRTTLLPVYLHLGLVLVAGVWLPAPLVAWFQSVSQLLG